MFYPRYHPCSPNLSGDTYYAITVRPPALSGWPLRGEFRGLLATGFPATTGSLGLVPPYYSLSQRDLLISVYVTSG